MIFWVFLYNLRLPVTAFCVLGIFLCILTAMRSTYNRDPSNTVGLIHVGVILAVLSSLVWAIPSPTYDQKIVYKDRKVEVPKPYPVYKGIREVPNAYQTVYDKCINSASVRADQDLIKQCHQQAKEASAPPQTVKVVFKPSPFLELFQRCNDYSLDNLFDKDPAAGVEARSKRMVICKDVALQGSTIH